MVLDSQGLYSFKSGPPKEERTRRQPSFFAFLRCSAQRSPGRSYKPRMTLTSEVRGERIRVRFGPLAVPLLKLSSGGVV